MENNNNDNENNNNGFFFLHSVPASDIKYPVRYQELGTEISAPKIFEKSE